MEKDPGLRGSFSCAYRYREVFPPVLFSRFQHEKAHDALRPFLQTRATQLAQEFAFLPTSPPREEGGIFELRAYQLNPGTLLDWEATWYVFHWHAHCRLLCC